MSEADPQRPKVIEAEQAVANIGKCEAGDETRRFAVMSALQRSIDGFPVRFLVVRDVLLTDTAIISMGSLVIAETSLTALTLMMSLLIYIRMGRLDPHRLLHRFPAHYSCSMIS